MALTPSTSRPRGRPRGFDDTTALEAAMRVFWARGYDQAPVDMLCRATNMPRTSLYNLFGDKEGLFLASVAHYARTRMRPVIEALGPNGTLAEDMAAFFAQVVHLACSDSDTPGCMISSVLSDAAVTTAGFRAERDRRLDALEARLAARLTQDGWPNDGACPVSVAAALAAAMARGIVARARSGQGADMLLPVGHAAVAALMALRGTTGDATQGRDRIVCDDV
ncbi:TetR/AcrR family transcriptional regulator [Paracoccus sp. Ld10]|uniref:TetR/AcrR family transcriptional regulator n=1 Tax=Paracoccus sp. Ld10 TaxID=649158 RepID=UPI003870CCC6